MRILSPAGRGLVLAASLLLVAGCSIKTMAVKTVASTLAESGDVFSSDNDPELVRDALPFALKLYESLLESTPKYAPLLVATCSAFTEYSYAFVQTDADILGTEHHDQAVELNDRALRLYVRGRNYCLRAMEVRFPGITGKLMSDPDAALKRAEKKDVPMLYWTAASWGAAVSLGIDKPDIVVDFPTVRALADRALALDGTWNKGAIEELMITLDSLPDALGGNADRARQDFTRAVALQQGASPGPYVALAEGVSVPAQNREEYERLLHQAIAIDPEKDPTNRLATLIAQRRARALLDQVDTRFSK